jgi:hypothetical protein
MLTVRWIGPRTARRDLRGLAVQLLGELTPRESALLAELIQSGYRGPAKDFVADRGFPRSIISVIFVEPNQGPRGEVALTTEEVAVCVSHLD